jgi:hypothetical protein
LVEKGTSRESLTGIDMCDLLREKTCGAAGRTDPPQPALP